MSANQKTELNKPRQNPEPKAWRKVLYILGHGIGVFGVLLAMGGISVGNLQVVLLGVMPVLLGLTISIANREDDEPIREIEQKTAKDKPKLQNEEWPTQEPDFSNELKRHAEALDPVEHLIQKVSKLKQDQEGIEQYRSILQAFQNKYPKILDLCSSKSNCSILHYEVMHARVQFIPILISLGANPDLQSAYPIQGSIALSGHDPKDLSTAILPAGITPLMIAARYSNPEIVQTLMAVTPKPNLELRDKEGITVLCHALMNMPPLEMNEEIHQINIIMVVNCLLNAGAPIENIWAKHKTHAFYFFVGALSRTYLIPCFLNYTDMTLENLFMRCITFCHIVTVKELIKLPVNLDKINEIDSKNLLMFMSQCVISKEDKLASFLISKIRNIKTFSDLCFYADHFDVKVKFLLESYKTNIHLAKSSVQKKQAAKTVKPVKPRSKPHKRKTYERRSKIQETKVLSEMDKLSALVSEKTIFYPAKIGNLTEILSKDKKILLELQSALSENYRINQRNCELPKDEEHRIQRLKENQEERQKVEQLLKLMSEAESKLHIFQRGFEGLQSGIKKAISGIKATMLSQDEDEESIGLTECGKQEVSNDKKCKIEKYKLKRMNLENRFIQYLLPLWENPVDGIGFMLELIKKKKQALSFAQEWQEYNRVDAKLKRTHKVDCNTPGCNTQAYATTTGRTHSPSEVPPSKEEFQIIKSGRSQKREKHFARKTERRERLKRFDHARRREKEEEAQFFASFPVETTPQRKSPTLQLQSSKDLASKTVDLESGNKPSLERGSEQGSEQGSERRFRSSVPQEFTMEMATETGKRTETLDEMDPIDKALLYHCPKNCDESRYRKYDSYDILLVCAQAMHSLDQMNQSIFPRMMANQFRNAIYKGKLFSEEDLIKRNSEIREMAKNLKNYISRQCQNLSGVNLNQSEIEKEINSAIFSEILRYDVPQLQVKDFGKHKDLCKDVMDKCLNELEEMLELKLHLTREKWISAFFLIKARLGAHFTYFKRNCASDVQYEHYIQLCGKYRRIANQIRHNQKRPVSKAKIDHTVSTSEMQDFATDLMLSSTSSDHTASVDINTILDLKESLGINQAELEEVAKVLASQADFTDYKTAFPPTALTMRSASVPRDSVDNTLSVPQVPEAGTVIFTQQLRRGFKKRDVRI